MNEVSCTKIRKLIGQGECLKAYDLATSCPNDADNHEECQYLTVLSLARSGATLSAQKLFDEFGFANSNNEDYAALGARLAKDIALNEVDGIERIKQLKQAAKQYHDVFKRTGGFYTAINAASLYKLSGKTSLANDLARQTLALCEQETAGQGLNEYYRVASMIEALLVLDDIDTAIPLLEKARHYADSDYAAMATTRRQLALLLPENKHALLALLTPPEVIHFCGHMISSSTDSGRFLPRNEKTVKAAIIEQLAAFNVAFAYGSLASGADILFAETLLERNAELHIILPFDMDEFIQVSVKPAGSQWVERFHYCIDKANSVSYSCDGSYLGDNTLFHYATRLAMGMAVQKANNLQAQVKQFAVWDGDTSTGCAGTYADIQTWQQQHNESILICSHDGSLLSQPSLEDVVSNELGKGQRRAHAMLFGDVKGFSKLNDEQIPAFVDKLFGALADSLEQFATSVLSTNTWGDGLFVVFEDALSASQCAMALQDSMRNLDLSKLGLPNHLALRLGVHYGPVYELNDPVLHRPNYFGAHVTKAARIEPITPEGEVYVTRQLSSELALIKHCGFSTEYVGVVPTAKKYGDMPMYLLRRTENK